MIRCAIFSLSFLHTATYSSGQWKSFQFTCVESTADYDCIIKNVFINESDHDVRFGIGYSYSKSKTRLMFSNSMIKSFPRTILDTFRRVEVLNLEHLRMEKIERNAFSNGRSIKQLYVSHNNIASLDPGVFDNLGSLERFVIENNNLSSLPNGLFHNSRNLRMVSLAYNNLYRIEDNTFDFNIKLDTIMLSGNRLIHFDLSRLMEVYDADVSNNNLKKLEIPVTLEFMNASFNEIDEITGKSGNELRLLILAHNKLYATAWFRSFTNLEILDLSHNHIEDITSKDFKQLTQLTELKLNDNRLFTLDMSKDIIKSLKVLDLSHNELVYVEHNQRQFELLEELYLDHNSIVGLKPSLSWKLKNITLSYNDWDCKQAEEFLWSFPSNITNDYDAEVTCKYEKLPRGLCCRREEMAYHTRLKEKFAQVSSYEKVARANGRCSVASQITLARNITAIVAQPESLSRMDLWKEVETLNNDVMRFEQQYLPYVTLVNKLNELTRKHAIVHVSLYSLPSRFKKLVDYLEYRNNREATETIHHRADSYLKFLDKELQKRVIKKNQASLKIKEQDHKNLLAAITQIID